MPYASWCPLWSGIVESSLWDEDDITIKVFITMLALKDSDHVCRATIYQLAKKTGKTQAQIMEAIRILSEPDARRQDHQEFEGRRIEAVEEGWLILNGEKYRQKVSEEMTRARNRRAQAKWREKQKTAEKFPQQAQSSGREQRFVKAHNNGDFEEADRIAAEGIPQREQEFPVSEQPTTNHPEVPEIP